MSINIKFNKLKKDEYELIMSNGKAKIQILGNHGEFRELIQKIDSKL